MVLGIFTACTQAEEEHYWIRANQIGYLPDDPKIALLSAQFPVGNFHCRDFRAAIGEDCGAWGPFAHNYRLDFSALHTPGTYQVQFGDQQSLPFKIGDDAYESVPEKLLEFMQLQRCGNNPVTGVKCHQLDAVDSITNEKVDLVGGWHDAADRLKHMITTTYCVAALYLAGATEEADYGAMLVRKIFQQPDRLYVQIGDDRDHMPPAPCGTMIRVIMDLGREGARRWRATGKPEGPKYQNQSTGLATSRAQCAALTLADDLEASRALYPAGTGK